MSCKSGIYVVNTQTGQSIGIGSTYVPLTVIRRYGKYCQLGGNGVSIGNCAGGAGYYDVDASVSDDPRKWQTFGHLTVETGEA